MKKLWTHKEFIISTDTILNTFSIQKYIEMFFENPILNTVSEKQLLVCTRIVYNNYENKLYHLVKCK